MREDDLQALRTAVAALEHPGLAARLAEIAGKPIELVGRALPETASRAVAAATTKALDAALSVAFRTMKNEPKAASSVLHKALAATSGAVGGSFGLAALPIELPISTIIMLRSIGDVARSEGEDLTDPETALNCLQVFALAPQTRTETDRRVSVAHVPLSLDTRAVIECGGHTFTLACQLCERVLAAQFPTAIPTTRLQTNIGERTMRSRHPAFRVSTNSGRHEILSPLVHGRWSASPFESFLQRQASPRQNRIENANSFLETLRDEPFQRQILPARYG